MEKPMSLDEYLHNPAGKGSNAIMSRDLIMRNLEHRFNEIQSNKEPKKRFSHTLLRDGRGSYYVHIIVPTESKERENTYDVVVKFYIHDEMEGAGNDTHLQRYSINVFSNIPSFTYTYAHVFNKNGLLIEELVSKFDDRVVDDAPDIRNPYYVTSYEKSIVFALIYIRDELRNVYNNKKNFDKVAFSWSVSYMTSKIRHTDTIRIEYDKEQKRLKSRRRKDTKPRSNVPLSTGGTKGAATAGVIKRGKTLQTSTTRKTKTTRKHSPTVRRRR